MDHLALAVAVHLVLVGLVAQVAREVHLVLVVEAGRQVLVDSAVQAVHKAHLVHVALVLLALVDSAARVVHGVRLARAVLVRLAHVASAARSVLVEEAAQAAQVVHEVHLDLVVLVHPVRLALVG